MNLHTLPQSPLYSPCSRINKKDIPLQWMYAKAIQTEQKKRKKKKKFCVCRCEKAALKRECAIWTHTCLYFWVLFLYIIYALFLRDQISQSLVLVMIVLSSFSFYIPYCVTILMYAVLYLQCLLTRREKPEMLSSSLIFDLLLWLWEVWLEKSL